MRMLIGIVTKAQGIKGELRVNCLVDNASQLINVKTLYLANNAHKVVKLRTEDNSFVVQFEDIVDRNTAETYRQWEVFANKEDVQLQDDSYFVTDLLKCTVFLDNGTKLGEVIDIAQHGSADVYTVRTDKGDVSFPWLKAVIVSIDVDNCRIVLSHAKLQEIIVYQYEN